MVPRALVVAAVVVATLLYPSVLVAGVESDAVDGHTYLHDSSGLDAPPQSGSAPTVFCPEGKTLIGLAGGIESGEVGHVNSLYPLDGPDDGARANDAVAVDAHNASGAGKTISAQAVCKGGERRYVTRDGTLGADAARGFSARCPAGTHVTGGGAFVGGDIGEGRLLSTTPFDGRDSDAKPDDGWRAEAANASATAESDVTVHAICQKRRPRYETDSSLTLTAGQEMSAQHDCEDEAHLLGAGADLALDPAAQATAILLQDTAGDVDLARDDLVSFTLTHTDAGGDDVDVTLTEICGRP